jgi:hypothetical protein
VFEIPASREPSTSRMILVFSDAGYTIPHLPARDHALLSRRMPSACSATTSFKALKRLIRMPTAPSARMLRSHRLGLTRTPSNGEHVTVNYAAKRTRGG